MTLIEEALWLWLGETDAAADLLVFGRVCGAVILVTLAVFTLARIIVWCWPL